MKIPVVLRDGQERSVDREEFQFLCITRQLLFFKRADGWVVVGRDQMRCQRQRFEGEERRQHGKFSRDHWY